MGWPGCSQCNNWPMVGYTGLCKECIKDPSKVESEAKRANDYFMKATEDHRNKAYLMAFLNNGPKGALLKITADMMITGKYKSVDEAIEELRTCYTKYSTRLKGDQEAILRSVKADLLGEANE